MLRVQIEKRSLSRFRSSFPLMVEFVFVCRCIFSPLLFGGFLMLGMGVGLLKPIKQIAEVCSAIGVLWSDNDLRPTNPNSPSKVFLVFGPTLIFGVLGCWGLFGKTIAPIANCCLMFPPTLAVYGHYKTGKTLVPPLVMLAAMTTHLYLSSDTCIVIGRAYEHILFLTILSSISYYSSAGATRTLALSLCSYALALLALSLFPCPH